MAEILFVNACVRKKSRTLELANQVLRELSGEIFELKLYETKLKHLDEDGMQKRDAAFLEKDHSGESFALARQFAAAETIVIAAPYWDLMFPSILKTYFEAVTVNGLTFAYGENGIPRGLCSAKRLIYVTTSGGPIIHNFGFDYTYALATSFYGMADVRCIKAEGLDIRGADVDSIMDRAKASVTEILGADTK